MGPLRLTEVVACSEELAATSSRLAKTALVADLLGRAGDDPEQLATVASWLGGTLRQGRVGVGWRSLTDLPEPAEHASLTVTEVDGVLDRLASEGGRTARAGLLGGLYGRATAGEQAYLSRLLLGEVRQGSLQGVLLAGGARAAGVPEAALRRAAMLAGDLPSMVALAMTGGEAALADVGLVPGRAVQPMLCGSAAEVGDVIDPLAGEPVALETKVDGIRVQVHKDALGEVHVFTRSLDDITARVPEVVELAESLGAGTFVLDGEAVALHPDGRPRPFQETGARTASRRSVEALRVATPLTTYLFDVLHLDGEDLLDAPLAERQARLAALVPAHAMVPRVVTGDPGEARAFFESVIAAGHEGVVVKTLDAPYAAGRRGTSWTKVKPRHTLDLVVLAVEWGSGRRRGLLSNIHLGARAEDGSWVMVGKTFKGMTDEMLAWQTARFLELETGRDGHVVHVRPEQVVEVAVDGVQRSTRYPGGAALRFARVLRYRDDKSPAEADTIDTIRAI